MEEKINEKIEKFSLMDVARMLVTIPLKDEVKIDSATLIILYKSGKKSQCKYKSFLGKEEYKNSE